MASSSPMDMLLDRVEWRCTQCHALLRDGCHCWDRTTPEEKQALAAASAKVFRALLKAHCPVVWHARSARTSLGNRLWSAVEGALQRLGRETSRGEPGLTTEEAQDLAEHVCYVVEDYWRWMSPDLYASVAPAYMARLWRVTAEQVEVLLAGCGKS